MSKKFTYMNGIDISKHNDLTRDDFDKIKSSGIDFVIIRAGYGKMINQVDQKFFEYYKYAKDAGLKVGAYWYSYALTEHEIEIECNCFLTTIKNLIFEMPVFLDFEEPSQFKLDKSLINNMIRKFLDKLEKKGYWAGLYMSRYYLQNYVDLQTVRNRYAIWVADYSSRTYYKNWGIWQRTDKFKIDNINCYFDLDKCIVDYPTLIKKKKINGYQNCKSSEQLVKEVLNGYFGNGEQRKKLLTEAGYNYIGVQALVNEELRK